MPNSFYYICRSYLYSAITNNNEKFNHSVKYFLGININPLTNLLFKTQNTNKTFDFVGILLLISLLKLQVFISNIVMLYLILKIDA